MKTYEKFREVLLSQVAPAGWLQAMLEEELSGFPGHLDEIGYPFSLPCWKLKTMAGGGFDKWWPYEQTAYWIDGVTRAAILTKNMALLDKMRAIIDASISHDADGFVGPDELKVPKNNCQWPHAVYFRALYALWSGTGEEKYLNAIRRHYLLPYTVYTHDRDAVNVETMLRVAWKTGDEALLNKARESYLALQQQDGKTADYGIQKMLTDTPTHLHGVTLNELGKLPALYYISFGDAGHLRAVEHLYAKIARDHLLPDGVHSSSEKTCGNSSLMAHESCDISDYTWSLGYLFAATGDGQYADLMERAILNALPGALGPQFKTVQYFSSVNQVRAARNSSHVEAFRNTPRMAFQPHHYPECCVGNISRALPNYVARMYWEDAGGVAAVLYGDSEYIGKGFRLTQTGGYPFRDTITFRVACDQPVSTTLRFRIPGWCKNAEIAYNGKQLENVENEGFFAISATFEDGDIITLHFAMQFSAHNSADGGIYYDYGPFLLALKIDEEWAVDGQEVRQSAAFPAYNVTPQSPWNYAVTGREIPEIISYDIKGVPFWDGIPITFRIPTRVLEGWTTVKEPSIGKQGDEGIDAKQISLGATEVTEELEQTPPLPDPAFVRQHLGAEQTITLVPYGCTHLRIAVFPKV